MSRHRNVRSLNYEEECDGYDEIYGHSVEDDFCVSPSTAAEFMYDRSQQQQHVLSTFMKKEHEPNIPEEECENDTDDNSLQDSSSFIKPALNDVQQAQLYSCLEEIRSVLGDSTPEHILTDAVVKADFNCEKALDTILCQQEAPKPQREPRKKRDRGTRVSADKIPAVDLEAKPAIKLSDPVPRVVAASGGDVTQGVARMTFSAGKHATMGFVEPEKNPETKDKEKMVKEAVTSNNINDDAVEKAPVTATETLKKDVTDAAVPKSVTRSKQEKLQVQKIYDKRKADNKAHLNLVVIGHVDAGKSTLMGHVLYQLGFVNKKVMHKHEQEAKKMGKASFAYAWVLDETEEERSRGVTMDIAQTRFETDTKVVTLLDAPGHKDFIPNMITGAAQADVAILVVNATRGEFETGFDMGGQTREHAMLIRSLGVSQLLVAVNKMDTVDWSKTRYDEIVKKLGTFLKQAGFKEADVSYVPCSGLIGENLTKPSNIPELCSWYHGPCVVQHIDKFRPPERLIDKPLRLSVTDIFKGQGAGFSVAGTIQAGCVQPADKVLVMPQGELATVKGILVDDAPAQIAFAGDSVILTLVGIEMTNIAIGSIVCDRNEPIRASTRFQARIVIFNIDLPITKGFPVEIHYQSLTEPGQVRRLISQLHKSTGEVIKKKPRCLVKNSNAVVEIEVERPICVELYRDYKDLGRVMLRSGGHTIAAGLVTEVVNGKKNN